MLLMIFVVSYYALNLNWVDIPKHSFVLWLPSKL